MQYSRVSPLLFSILEKNAMSSIENTRYSNPTICIPACRLKKSENAIITHRNGKKMSHSNEYMLSKGSSSKKQWNRLFQDKYTAPSLQKLIAAGTPSFQCPRFMIHINNRGWVSMSNPNPFPLHSCTISCHFFAMYHMFYKC